MEEIAEVLNDAIKTVRETNYKVVIRRREGEDDFPVFIVRRQVPSGRIVIETPTDLGFDGIF